MFVRIKPKPNGKKSVQIVESYRRADKVSQKIVRHIGQAVTDREVEEMTRLAQSIITEMEEEKQPTLPFFDPMNVLKAGRQKKESGDTVKVGNLREEQRIIDGIGDVFGKLYKDLKLDKLIGGTHKDAQWNDILESCVLARIANPVSKRRTASLLEEDYGIKIPLEKIYRVMDHVADREADIKQHIAQTTLSLFKEHVDVLFFDVTTLYFESIETDELRDFGFSKDCKFKEVQVVLALVTTTKGLPITYRLFPGNTYEGGTLVGMVQDLQTQYTIDNILLVADRAMFNEENLSQMESLGIQYIVAAKLKALPRNLKTDIFQAEYKADVIGDELHWLKEFEHKSRRLVVGYSSKRAKKDAADRQRLVDRLMKKVKGNKIHVKDLIPNYGSKKYITVENSSATINQEKIEADAQWDGLHGVITNVADKTPGELLSRYRELWQIEEAFRINKHDLKMRPIFHWTENRIKAHIAICFLAFTLAKQAVYRIALQQDPMSFEQIRNELLHAQSSVVIDLASQKKYVIPSHVTVHQKKLYQVFGLKRSQVPYRYPD
ncbi:MAG: IS1634 family transposase [Smithella sp.]|jgi:transposase